MVVEAGGWVWSGKGGGGGWGRGVACLCFVEYVDVLIVDDYLLTRAANTSTPCPFATQC